MNNAPQIASDLFQIIDSNPAWTEKCKTACIESVRNNDASVADPKQDYINAAFWFNSDWHTFLDCAGLRVKDVFLDLVDNLDHTSFAYMALMSLVDVDNRQVWSELAEHFMPDDEEAAEEL